ncbi:MAG: M23 family metallopeptidase [bacterium]
MFEKRRFVVLNKKIFFGCILSICLSLLHVNCLFAGFPNLKLPFSGGETWETSCAYDGSGGDDCKKTHVNTDRYALDFNWRKEVGSSGSDDCDKPAIAVSMGTVVLSEYSVDKKTGRGYGNCVKIDHGDGYFSFYAHLVSRSVEVGDVVAQGKEIGKVGHTGGDFGCHLHFAFYKIVDGVKTACKAEPMSDYINFVDGNSYSSDNYPPVFYTQPDGTVVKFDDSSRVYYSSNGKFWPILNEETYVLLGYRKSDCSVMAPDWSYVIPAPSSEKAGYVIRREIVPSENDYSIGRRIAYKVVPKMGHVSCSQTNVDPVKIYLFKGGKFHHIPNEDVYYELGYAEGFVDVVQITPELFTHYGEGEEAKAPDSTLYTNIPSGYVLSDSSASPTPAPTPTPPPSSGSPTPPSSGSPTPPSSSTPPSSPAPAPTDILLVPDQYRTIQEAFDAAGNGYTVLVDSGTYFENIKFSGKAITIRSKNGAENTIIDGGGKGAGIDFHLLAACLFD